MNSNCPVHNYLQHTYSENHFANFFCLCSASPQPVQHWASAGDPFYSQPQPRLPAPSFPIQRTVTPLTTVNNRWRCPICLGAFSRWQERDRHELIHLPYFMHCPLPHCAWRGNRAGTFKNHWRQEDHRSYHEIYGRTPERSQIETFDPWVILNQIANGAITPREGEVQAILLVRMKACELQRLSMWMEPWGRNTRHLMGRTQRQPRDAQW